MIGRVQGLIRSLLAVAILFLACKQSERQGATEYQAQLGTLKGKVVCRTCPIDEPPPPPPVPDLCGGRRYSVPYTPQPWPSDWGEDFRKVHSYAQRIGYPHAFRNFHAAVIPNPDRAVWGTFFVKPQAQAVFRDIPRSAQADVAWYAVPDMMRATHSYANSIGFAAGLPTFHHIVRDGVEYRGVFFFNGNAVEFRDVPACELGFPNRDDVGQMFRAANDYSVRAGFVGAYPTFHYRDAPDGNTYYGIILFRPGMAEWRDVNIADLDTTCGADGQVQCAGQCDRTSPYYWRDLNGWCCRMLPEPTGTVPRILFYSGNNLGNSYLGNIELSTRRDIDVRETHEIANDEARSAELWNVKAGTHIVLCASPTSDSGVEDDFVIIHVRQDLTSYVIPTFDEAVNDGPVTKEFYAGNISIIGPSDLSFVDGKVSLIRIYPPGWQVFRSVVCRWWQ